MADSGPGAGAAPVLVRGGRLVDPLQGLNDTLDLLVRDARVRQSGAILAPPMAARCRR